jgi:hypothetical protein
MKIIENANYYEIIIMKSENVYDLGECEFSKILSKMISTDYKFFERQYKEYFIDDIIIHNYNNEETKVSKLKPKNYIDIDNYRIIGYQKTKLTSINYPSTTYIFNINYIKKLIFRVSNRIYINFEISLDEDSLKTYKVYINYNHDQNVDFTLIDKTLDDIIKLLLE